ncbi:PQQ-dependent sugar dehydrogenase [Natronoglycomyces albus]|uniref:PQQ-dependent sugar dehydrogenase n=1 Tax=Natronoglycomyces albus TaxID=2811108 RepID=A0A895XNI3_9ACTN|nr:PQQ-dependent sugar dehydrogenase [Natronoglycomyces albus]QSB06687.1 PQQ-dependent sugar dehydrogenase [Natronoglycomyces albus]
MGRNGLIGLVAALVLVIAGVGAFIVLRDDNDEPPSDEATNNDSNDSADDSEPSDHDPVIETVAEGFDQPWGLEFLPEGDQLLVTELVGTLAIVDIDSGDVRRIDGVPDVSAEGQGGLLDVAIDPDFPDSSWVYLTYSAATDDGNTSTHLARGQLDLDQATLRDVEELYVAEPATQAPVHYGSKIVFGVDGNLYMTIGDRGDKNFADHVSQDPSNTLGTTVRLRPDGSIPEDNPFIDDGDIADEIYTYGHRNVQGMTVHPLTGVMWQSEHGEEDGDEINIVEGGHNYGWPIAHSGCEYGTDTPIGDHPLDRDEFPNPAFFWECGSGGFPPGGLTFYEGDQFPAWEGNLLVGGLASEQVARFIEEDGELIETEPLLADEGWRIRDIVVSPHDGAIYVAIDDDDVPLIRLVDGTED